MYYEVTQREFVFLTRSILGDMDNLTSRGPYIVPYNAQKPIYFSYSTDQLTDNFPSASVRLKQHSDENSNSENSTGHRYTTLCSLIIYKFFLVLL